MFFRAIDWGYAHSNPVRKVKFFSEKDRMKERVLTEDEESRLLEASPEELKPIILTALHTGMRRKEILNLQWKDVDLEKKYIKVVETKSGRNRTIPINSILIKKLSPICPQKCGTPKCIPRI